VVKLAAKVQAALPRALNTSLFTAQIAYLPVNDTTLSNEDVAGSVTMTATNGKQGPTVQAGVMPKMDDDQMHVVRQ
jgi:hypothetical protein